ncbi:MAG TPA: DUF6179 domain-containing protein [Bacillota bacterium]|nr:DUF6179 domain-containing protein [Bacillota bacterium]HOK69703.1 DUF6179 domain-containing protein [Bacillota bacterium]HPP86109.1 DUF6179 domain-containing protein [Bacillota bacterium]
MYEIERTGIIRSERLSGEYYFSSLLAEAQRNGLISSKDIDKIEFDCFMLLGERTNRYTNGESSSVPVETAQGISNSILYTLGVALKSYPTPDDALNALLEAGVGPLYVKGRRLIDKKIQAAKRLYASMLKNMVVVDNLTYKSTLRDGIRGFFKIYDPEFSAQEICITADYPTFLPINDLAGIEYMHRYIKSLYYENKFCKLFPDSDIENLLYGYSEEYKHLVINIFGLVLTNALGRVMLGKNPLGLSISKDEAAHLEERLSRLTKEQIGEAVHQAFAGLCESLNIESEPLREYLENALPEITSIISIACEKRILTSVFIEFAYPKDAAEIAFDFGQKMNPIEYNQILTEINDCRYTSDKIAIIESSVRSLADLEDILLDASFTDAEAYEVFGILSVYEIAALAKKYAALSKDDAAAFDENEEKLRNRLNQYISLQSDEKRAGIERLYKKIKV